MSVTDAVIFVDSLSSLPARGRVVTIGTFDGVHLGHQALVAAAVRRAGLLALTATAVTFEPVPAAVLRPEQFPGRICSAADKLQLLARLGLDEIVRMRFDRTLAEQSPEAFMESVAATGLAELWVGEAFALGKNRAGNVERLTEIGERLGFAVHALPRVSVGDETISSSAIRLAIMSGEVERAERLLGRAYRVAGEVIHGAHFGRKIGYPTANVRPPAGLAPLADGIYASQTMLPDDSAPRPSMTYVGTRPTVDGGDRIIETHVLDFDGDLYGRNIEIEILGRLRGDQIFPDVGALVVQMRQDEATTRRFFINRHNAQIDRVQTS